MRQAGWYWVRDSVEGWHPAHWDVHWTSPHVIRMGGVRDSEFEEIGPRIPTPDEELTE